MRMLRVFIEDTDFSTENYRCEINLTAKSRNTLKRAAEMRLLSVVSRLQPAYAFSPDIYVGA